MDTVNVYAGVSVINDVVGRADYVSSPVRQENLLAVAGIQDMEYWKQLAKDAQLGWCRAGGSRDKQAREAKEIQLLLPKKVLDMTNEERQEIAEKLSRFFSERYGADNITGIHLSKTKNNVHAHILFPVRTKLPEPEIQIAKRNTWIDDRGVVCRTKKEAHDENKQLRPGYRFVPKGAVLFERHFGDVDPVFNRDDWTAEMKEELAAWINDVLDPDVKRTVFDPDGPYLAQMKIGKGWPEETVVRLQEYNKAVRGFNDLVKRGVITHDRAHAIKTQVLLAPDRIGALRAALQMDLGHPVPKNPTPGGVRTSTGPDEESKRRLRELYRLAAECRRRARETEDEFQKQLLWQEARKHSAQIERLRRELGYYKDADYERRLRRIDEELRRKLRWLDSCRRRYKYLEHKCKRLRNELYELKEELRNLPLFKNQADRDRERSLKGQIAQKEKEWLEAQSEMREAREAWRKERKLYQAMKRDMKSERKDLIAEQRQRADQRAKEQQR